MEAQSTVHVPRVAIRFCTQCKWNLRAAYYAQELLQTFATSIGEISLIPMTGGIFDITLYHISSDPEVNDQQPTPTTSGKTNTNTNTSTSHMGTNTTNNETIKTTLIWERKRDGGFPETKELKNRIRNVIDPSRDMGHIDRSLNKGKSTSEASHDATATSNHDSSNVNAEPVAKSGATNDVKPDGGDAVISHTEELGATGGENLQFGSNIENDRGGGDGGVSISNEKHTHIHTPANNSTECEDCK